MQKNFLNAAVLSSLRCKTHRDHRGVSQSWTLILFMVDFNTVEILIDVH